MSDYAFIDAKVASRLMHRPHLMRNSLEGAILHFPCSDSVDSIAVISTHVFPASSHNRFPRSDKSDSTVQYPNDFQPRLTPISVPFHSYYCCNGSLALSNLVHIGFYALHFNHLTAVTKRSQPIPDTVQRPEQTKYP